MGLLGWMFALALAAEPEVPKAEEKPSDDLWQLLENMPPRASWDLAAAVGFVEITHFRDQVTPWVGFGFRGGWGKHLGERRNHRVGAGAGVYIEGQIPEFFTIAIEPTANWDYVSPKGFAAGASLGPAILVHSNMTLTEQQWKPGISPVVAARVGWSKPFSRVLRRLFVVVEPRVRWMDGRVNPGVYVVLGTGTGY